LGLRDRAMMEVLYSTGIRRVELSNLELFDIDRERGTLTVRQGKGRKDRVVPIGERALGWIAKYLATARPELVAPPDHPTLFLNDRGEKLGVVYLTHLIGGYVEAAKTGKTGSCHLFRHTMATLMLEGGADVRHIQEILGHVQLSTTSIYTRVSIRHLKAVHDATHPGAKSAKPSATNGAASSAPDDDAPLEAPAASEASLLSLLAAEAAEEAETDTEGDSGDAAAPTRRRRGCRGTERANARQK
jgi:integrase/recombinase XerD